MRITYIFVPLNLWAITLISTDSESYLSHELLSCTPGNTRLERLGKGWCALSTWSNRRFPRSFTVLWSNWTDERWGWRKILDKNPSWETRYDCFSRILHDFFESWKQQTTSWKQQTTSANCFDGDSLLWKLPVINNSKNYNNFVLCR